MRGETPVTGVSSPVPPTHTHTHTHTVPTVR